MKDYLWIFNHFIPKSHDTDFEHHNTLQDVIYLKNWYYELFGVLDFDYNKLKEIDFGKFNIDFQNKLHDIFKTFDYFSDELSIFCSMFQYFYHCYILKIEPKISLLEKCEELRYFLRKIDSTDKKYLLEQPDIKEIRNYIKLLNNEQYFC